MKQDKCDLNFTFETTLVNAPFVHFQRSLVVLCGNLLYVLYIDTNKQTPISQIPIQEGTKAQMCHVNTSEVIIMTDDRMYYFDTKAHVYEEREKQRYNEGLVAPIGNG